ncbi:MAG: hypothetical protein K2M46_13660 [Lachnospiraceae bacterium]|nr:hypothetical protein [Lachnospiraceae bacterium]
MDLLEELKAKGVNVEEAIERFLGNASLYEKMLMKFLDLMNDMAVDTGFDCNEYNDIIEKTHAIKGAAGNLSITPIYEAYTDIVNLLRAQQPEQAKLVLEKIVPVQNDIIECIKKYHK